MSEEPRLHPRSDNDRQYITPTREVKMPTLSNGTLPWYAIFRMNLSQLVTLGMLLITATGVFFKVQAHEADITFIKATAQTKDAASSDQKLILQRLDDLEKNFNRRLDDLKDDLQESRKQRR